jgi:phosphate uptake regulator
MRNLRHLVTLALCWVWASGLPCWCDLTAARADRNLERRSDKALDNAVRILAIAKQRYAAGDLQGTHAAIEEVRDSVELSFKSLRETGKDPRKSPKHFKRAELMTRQLLRRLRDFQLEMAVEDRQQVEAVRDYVREVHEKLLAGILGEADWKK